MREKVHNDRVETLGRHLPGMHLALLSFTEHDPSCKNKEFRVYSCPSEPAPSSASVRHLSASPSTRGKSRESIFNDEMGPLNTNRHVKKTKEQTDRGEKRSAVLKLHQHPQSSQ